MGLYPEPGAVTLSSDPTESPLESGHWGWSRKKVRDIVLHLIGRLKVDAPSPDQLIA